MAPSMGTRAKTFLGDAQTSSTSRHQYFIQRPAFAQRKQESTALQPIQSQRSNEIDDVEPRSRKSTEVVENGASDDLSRTPSQTEPLNNILAENRRFELFIDLVWTGIIANIAENYSESSFEPESTVSVGRAFLSSIILTLIAWRMWKMLQDFMNTFATRDLIEKAFVVWYLILALLFGNNAPYFFAEGDEQTSTAVVVYLLAKFSLLALETVYALFIPSMRMSVLVRWIAAPPLSAFWIASFFVDYPTKAGMAFGGVVLEAVFAILVTLPRFSKYLQHDVLLADDNLDHWVERIRDFFIIVLGEAVVNFIRGSPLGRGLNWNTGTGIIALAIWYILINLYFNGDQARYYIHASKRAWWRTNIWQTAHVLMFHGALLSSVAVRFILAHPSTSGKLPKEPSEEDTAPPAENNSQEPSRLRIRAEEEVPLEILMNRAKWTAAIALAVLVTCFTVLAVLSRSLDKPGTFKVDNRYLRLALRPVMVIVTLCIPLREEMTGASMLGVILALLYASLMFEWWGSMDKGGRLIER